MIIIIQNPAKVENTLEQAWVEHYQQGNYH
jgi:hypothetical protein